METKKKTDEKKNQPETKFRSGSVTATVWKNQYKDEDGKMRDTHSVSVIKSYKDKNDEWKETNSYGSNDLADLESVSQEARKYLRIKNQ